MGKPIKIRAKIKDDPALGPIAVIKALMPHPMESGIRIDTKTGEVVPKHYIQEIVCKHNDKVVMNAYWGTGVSKNPYVSFQVKNVKPGDKLEISWLDNTGDTSVTETVLK